MPVRTPEDLLEQTTGRSRTFLGSGNFGEALLFPNARRSLVAKRMKSSVAKSFLREVRALGKVRGIEGVQQWEAVVDEGDHFVVVSQYAGIALSRSVSDQLLSRDQLMKVHE